MYDGNDVTIDETRTRDSFNSSTSNNTSSLAVDLDSVTNTDNSVNDSGNESYTADGSFHEGSYNTDNSQTDSNNDVSFSEMYDNSDNSVNTWTDASDHSINAGNRSYDLGGGGAAGGSATVVDQSLNANILSGGGVAQWVSPTAIVGSGEGAMVAGGDLTFDYTVDASTTIDAGGDILIDGSTKNVTEISGSYNSSTESYTYEDNSQDWDLDNVGNSESYTLTIDGSFTETSDVDSTETWDVDANVIWDSDVAAVVDGAADIDVAL
ncbi:hypothetical protein ACIQLJ_14025 [Microbacterium sp. NPDC091313]